MNCPHCGAEVSPGNRFCNRCRKRVSPEPGLTAGAPSAARSGPPPARRPPTVPRPSARASHAGGSFTRPGLVTLLAVLDLIGGVAGIGLALLLLVGARSAPPPGAAPGEFFAIIAGVGLACAAMGALQIAVGIGLLGLRPWARTLRIVLAFVGLIGIPCGTLISILVLVYLLKPEVKLLFSGASPQELDPEELAMVERLGQGSGAVVALVAVVVLFVGIAGVGIIAAIAIPSLLRARVSANEAAAIGDLRTVISGEAAYASSNGGFSDTLECLAAPQRCIPGYPEAAPHFLDAGFATPTRHGYRFRFVAGPAAAAEAGPGGRVSPSSMRAFAYIAEPLTPGQTGVRAFCGEASGIICSSGDGRIQDEGDGGCPVGCAPLY